MTNAAQCCFRGSGRSAGALRWAGCPYIELMLREVVYAARTSVRNQQELREVVFRTVGTHLHRLAAHNANLDCYLSLSSERIPITEFVAARALAAHAEIVRTQLFECVEKETAPPGANR